MKDQLLKAGLVSKKQVRKHNQKARKARKKKQSQRESKAVIEAREKAQTRARREQQQQQRLEARRARERAKEQAEARRRVDQILNAHRVRFRSGTQPFWHPSPDRRFLFRLDLPERVAHDVHIGKLGVSWRGPADADDPDVVLIPREIVERIQRIDPDRILFHNDAKPSAPEDALFSAG
ncbi:MAG: DUF2058 family protein [Myxococcota bacterium]